MILLINDLLKNKNIDAFNLIFDNFNLLVFNKISEQELKLEERWFNIIEENI
jgi:hypothetical protein